MLANDLKTISDIVAEKLNVPKDIVLKINKTFWNDVKTEIESHTENNIYIKNLGTFCISISILRKKIINLINIIKHLKKEEKYDEINKAIMLKDHYTTLRTLLETRNKHALNLKQKHEDRLKRIEKINKLNNFKN